MFSKLNFFGLISSFANTSTLGRTSTTTVSRHCVPSINKLLSKITQNQILTYNTWSVQKSFTWWQFQFLLEFVHFKGNLPSFSFFKLCGSAQFMVKGRFEKAAVTLWLSLHSSRTSWCRFLWPAPVTSFSVVIFFYKCYVSLWTMN